MLQLQDRNYKTLKDQEVESEDLRKLLFREGIDSFYVENSTMKMVSTRLITARMELLKLCKSYFPPNPAKLSVKQARF
jgi:hypothetical protein